MPEPEHEPNFAKPYFSIIMTAYNAAIYLEESLSSVKKQTCTDYEIVVVDNGSADNTAETAKKILEKNNMQYQLICEKKNLGIGGARNVAAKAAKGKILAILDADDIWYSEKLAKVKDVLDRNPNIGVVCHDENLVKVEGANWKTSAEWLSAERKIIGRMKYGPYAGTPEKMYESLLWNGNCLSTSATCVRKELFEKAGGFSAKPEFFGVEDYDLWLKLAKFCPFYFITEPDTPLGEYRISGSNTYTLQLQRHIDSEISVLKNHIAQLPESVRPKANSSKVKKREAALYVGAGWYLHRQGNFAKSREWYMKSIRHYPLIIKGYGALALSYLHVKW